MSETAKQLFDSLRSAKEAVQAMLPGLKKMGAEVGAEMSRLGTQGAMELASALFNGDGFVPYGPGQYTPTPEHGQEQPHEQQQEQQREIGRER